MRISNELTDEAVMAELGARLRRRRLQQRDLTQARLAAEAGVSTATVARIEAGQSVQLTSLIRVLRQMEMLDALERLVPPPTPSPIERLARSGRERQRARSTQADAPATPEHRGWSWGDDGRDS